MSKSDKKSKEKTGTNPKKNLPIEAFSRQFKNGTFLETIYDPNVEQTSFLMFVDGAYKVVSEFADRNVIYIPPPATNNLIRDGHVLLPSAYVDFGSSRELFDLIRKFIHDYVELPRDFEVVATCYVMLTWVYDLFENVPYVRVVGAYGTGKSRFLKIMSLLCYRAFPLFGATSTSAIYNLIDSISGTLVLDEADFLQSNTHHEMIKILNSGFERGAKFFKMYPSQSDAKVLNPRAFKVFCPKVVATRELYEDDAVESRFLTNPMEVMERNDLREVDESTEHEAMQIRNKLLSFRFNKLSEPDMFPMPTLSIEPRLLQVVSPFFKLIDYEDVRVELKRFVLRKQNLQVDGRFNSEAGKVLRSYLKALQSKPGRKDEPFIGEIAEQYNADFAERYTKPITARKVGVVVRNILHLQVKGGDSRGYYVVFSEKNMSKLKKLLTHYGISEGEVDVMDIEDVKWEDIDKQE